MSGEFGLERSYAFVPEVGQFTIAVCLQRFTWANFCVAGKSNNQKALYFDIFVRSC